MTDSVVQLCQSFSPISETFIYDLVSELGRQGVDVHVAAYKRINEKDRPFANVHLLAPVSRWQPARLFHRLLAATPFSTVQLHALPMLRPELRKLIQEINPTVIHAQFGILGVLAAPVARELGIPLVVTFHGFDVNQLTRERSIARAYVRLFKQGAVGVTVSHNLFDKLKHIGVDSRSLRVLHNGTRLESLGGAAVFHEHDRELETVRVLFVGRLVEVKSPFDLLEAFARARHELAPSGIRLELTLAGDGDLRAAVESYVRRETLRDYVHVLGSVSHDKVRELMRTHDVYAQHNRRASNGSEEGLGVTLIEAQAHGLPVVGTVSGGVPEVVSDGKTGFLVSAGDVDAMAAKLVQLARDPGLRANLGANGRRITRQKFDIRIQVERLISIYKEVAV